VAISPTPFRGVLPLPNEEVARLLGEAEDRAIALLESHRESLEKVVALLLERETIDGEDVEGALGKRGAPDVTVVMDAEPSQN
jgi:ATP-dependent Zn protease